MILCIFSSSNLFFYFNFSHHRTRSKKGGVRQQTLLCHHSNACKSTLKCLVSSIKKDNKLSRKQHAIVFFFFFLFFSEEILAITALLHTRKFGQAPILLQSLSSYPHVFIMFMCESIKINNIIKVAGTGVQTADPWITKPALYLYPMGDCT